MPPGDPVPIRTPRRSAASGADAMASSASAAATRGPLDRFISQRLSLNFELAAQPAPVGAVPDQPGAARRDHAIFRRADRTSGAGQRFLGDPLDGYPERAAFLRVDERLL